MSDLVHVAIVGSRDYPDLRAVRRYVRALPRGTVVITGGARGVDRIVEDEAKRCGLMVRIYLPDWERDGKAAGFIRNRHIVDAAERLVAFHHDGSKGTADSIRLARKRGIPVEVYEA